MAHPERDERFSADRPPIRAAGPTSPGIEAGGQGYEPGGEIGRMQADLARRLSRDIAGEATSVASGERLVRFLSVAGGYAALLAGCSGMVVLLLR